ncbi:hypothetical protein BpHYR1_022829 [Brachionus plicatilis]|uniref:Uncharacterized protein n=1 Tax=Brachionus plicatilis TaxID=10195 RepID=A0A3M7QH19_BRAPC|nr:hypothetical protein BpHYR1_022829 [Brachionus plicatilis]
MKKIMLLILSVIKNKEFSNKSKLLIHLMFEPSKTRQIDNYNLRKHHLLKLIMFRRSWDKTIKLWNIDKDISTKTLKSIKNGIGLNIEKNIHLE